MTASLLSPPLLRVVSSMTMWSGSNLAAIRVLSLTTLRTCNYWASMILLATIKLFIIPGSWFASGLWSTSHSFCFISSLSFFFFLFSLLFENKKLPLKETANVILAEGFFICRMAFMELCGICRTCLRCGIHHSFDGFMIIHQAYHCINMTAFKVTLNDSFSYWRPLFNEWIVSE